MPHQCVNCDVLYPDETTAIVTGCSCGSVAFFFVREKVDLQQIQDEVKKRLLEENKPIIFDLETVNMTPDGKYEIDLHALFGKNELIFKEEDGHYTVDIQESFRRHMLTKKE